MASTWKLLVRAWSGAKRRLTKRNWLNLCQGTGRLWFSNCTTVFKVLVKKIRSGAQTQRLSFNCCEIRSQRCIYTKLSSKFYCRCSVNQILRPPLTPSQVTVRHTTHGDWDIRCHASKTPSPFLKGGSLLENLETNMWWSKISPYYISQHTGNWPLKQPSARSVLCLSVSLSYIAFQRFPSLMGHYFLSSQLRKGGKIGKDFGTLEQINRKKCNINLTITVSWGLT